MKPESAALVTSDFACEHLAIRRLTLRESISQPYRLDLLLVARDPLARPRALDPDDVVGSQLRVDLLDQDGRQVRTFRGIVAGARQCSHEGAHAHAAYELEVVPRAWQLGLVTTQEIFIDQSVPDVIAAKLARIGLEDKDVVFRTHGRYPKREFVVQYRESVLAFISRLAEHLGLSFFFEAPPNAHERVGGEVMVFTDRSDGFGPSLGQVQFSQHADTVGVYHIAKRTRLVPRIHVVQDYNHRHPLLNLTAVHQLEGGGGGLVEYGTHHKGTDEGTALAEIRAQETTAGRCVYEGQSTVAALSAGARFTLDDHSFLEPVELLVTEVSHVFDHNLGWDDGAVHGYKNSFAAVPSAQPYRPPRITPRPRIHGVVTGVVQVTPTAPLAAQARIDEQGSYVVQFHFDGAPNGQKASRPVRMAQPFAGPHQGMHFPLRPGTEVVLAFVDGDPDRPIIVGALPNATTPSRVVAADSHMHRIRSRYGLTVEFGTATRD